MEDKELKILLTLLGKDNYRASLSEIKLSQTKAAERDEICRQLCDRKLIDCTKVASKKNKEVSLSEKGKEFLVKEYLPTGGGNLTLSKTMLKDYLSLIRKFGSSAVNNHPQSSKEEINLPKPSDEEILQTIIELDKELGTENFLPIFHLREKLQPPLSRDELDQAIYRLQKQDKLELSSLVEAVYYTPEQICAGIPQDIGGSLFYLIVI